MQILIKPFDTLFFRDGKPFDMGESNIASIISFPTPSTIHGAIASMIISQNNIPLNKAKKLKDSLKITDISLIKDKNFLYPIPLDTLIDEEKSKGIVLNIRSEPVFHNVKFTKNLLISKELNLKAKNVFISDVDLEDYLNNKRKIYYEEDISKIEYKVGIGLNRKTNTVQESKLYRIPLIRLDDKVKLYVNFEIQGQEFDDIKLENRGYIKLGGENKISFYEKAQNLNIQLNINTEQFDGIFKIYLRTPAIFKNGYIPDWMIKGEYKGLKFEFLAASIGKFKLISGFDINKGKIKNSYKAVPEGSVYYLKTDEKDLFKIKSIFESESISDLYKNEGFGLAYIGIGG